MLTPIRHYLREIDRAWTAGNATEHTYRPALKALVESFGSNVRATNEPKRVACGAPDFIVARPEVPIGFIECKDIGTSLDVVEKTDQLDRYFASLENFILTDYLEFRYYVRGEQTMHVRLARIVETGKVRFLEGADEQLARLFDNFMAAEPQTITTPKDLAGRMARIAQVIRDAIEKAFTLESEEGTLHSEFESFRATILGNITAPQFADMYAQTVCYGLFSARVNVPDHMADAFTREHAVYDLPKTNPFLRDVFEYIAGTKLDPSIVWAVDLLAQTLRQCEMGAILRNFGKATRQEDPVVHFYETFLAAYDPALREMRGVYYTPEPVVGFIVRSVDAILKRDFGCSTGLADNSKITVEVPNGQKKSGKTRQEVHRVQILDPATGTGTFLYETIRQIEKALSGNKGSWAGERGYVAKHLLPRVYGFELMMAPYAVAHMKLGWLLKETGYDFAGQERLRVYLTNTLEEAEIVAGPLLALANQIAREANAASKVKVECPIMVVMGNPPYSGHSANKSQWSRDLIKKKLPSPGGAPGYFECDGAPLNERNSKWINNDYVKFIRFGQYRIEQTGYGILAFITDNSYLDSPTFRGVRRSLMHTFDDLYVLDLHGNANKKETAPDGTKDENVFDITQGVAIAIFVRKPARKARGAQVFQADAFGLRAEKYGMLARHDLSSTRWTRVDPSPPGYLFRPQGTRYRREYELGWRLCDAMPVSSVGVVTGDDKNVVAFEKAGASDLAAAAGLAPGCVRPLLYRPFDRRFLVYDASVVTRPRLDVMRHMLAGENLALITTRQTRDEWEVFLTRDIAGHKSCAAFDINSVFPLYLYGNGALPPSLFEQDNGRRPNFAAEFIEALANSLGLRFLPDGRGDAKKTFGPEDVFHYAYAVFHSPTYRSRYAEFLKTDFPRLPLTGNKNLFAVLLRLGRKLASLHLLETVPTPAVRYPRQGDNLVRRVDYKPPTPQSPGRVCVNDQQYFADVPPDVFTLHVGGYQVCEKWLKDRKGRCLSYDDIEHYRRITESVRQSLRLMTEIDEAIAVWPLT